MKITRQRVFPSIKSWYIFPKMVIRFIIFFHYLGLKFIFQDFFKVPRILQNWVRIPWFRPSKTYWSFRVWWELYVLPPSYIYDYYTQLLGAAQSSRMSTGLGVKRLGGCCCLYLYFAWGILVMSPLWAQLSLFPNKRTWTGWLTFIGFLPPLSDSPTCPSNTFDFISGLQLDLLSQKGHESIYADYMVPWAKWLIQRLLKESEQGLLKMAQHAWIVDWIQLKKNSLIYWHNQGFILYKIPNNHFD